MSDPPNYDEQLGLSLTQSFTALAYNVTAVAQTDSNDYGPAYLLNGLTDKGYWYQVGLSWNWPYSSGSYNPGFNMIYAVFDSSGKVVFPTNGGGGLLSFSGPVNQGDTVLLNLYFTATGQVEMLASDQTTGAQAYEKYSAQGATYFTGTPSATSNAQGFFTGLMTEWWHTDPYYGDEQKVVYSVCGASISSAWMWIDEWNPQTNQVLFSDSTPSPVSYSNPTLLQTFSSHNATEASNAYEFITGSLSTVTLPSVTISPGFAIIDVGQSQPFNSTVSNGASPYSFQWYLDGVSVPSATSSTWTFTPSSSGSYSVYVNVTDSVAIRAKSNIATVTVNPALSVSISPTSITLDVGQPQLFSSNVSGGTSPCTYQWCLNNNPVSGATSSSWTFTPASDGFYSVYVNATDNAGFRVKSNTAFVVVFATLSASISPGSVTMYADQFQQFTSNVTGGMASYSYQWYLNGSKVSGATRSTWTFTPSSAGFYTVYLEVTDNLGMLATSNTANVTVNTYTGQLFHDVAVTNVTSSKNAYVEGDDITVNITVKNEGNYTETFNVTLYGKTLYGNAWPIYTFTGVPLAPGSTTTLTIGVDFGVGFYTLSAYAWPVPGETHTSDNTYVGVTVLVAPFARFRPWSYMRPIAV